MKSTNSSPLFTHNTQPTMASDKVVAKWSVGGGKDLQRHVGHLCTVTGN